MAAILTEHPAAKIVVRRDRLDEAKALAGFKSNDQVARAAGMHPTQFSRVLSGRSEPGNKFIAGILEVFGVAAFPRLFEVVTDNATA